MIAIVGAGAMGTALAMVHQRAGLKTSILGTRFDDATVDACRSGQPHPALGVALDRSIDVRGYGSWGAVLRNAERVVIGVSSNGLADVVGEVAPLVGPGVTWVVATKGWDAETLLTPVEIIEKSGGDPSRVVILAGPALAPELVAGAPTSMVCACRDVDVASNVAASLTAAGLSANTTDDVVGAEVAAAYKNVTAIAVGICEGLSERLPERVYIHRFANARAAMFAKGLEDMTRLAMAQGGRIETIVGLAGAGDLYVTCLGGRNGNYGRLIGSGQNAEQAQRTIGSTVEGVAATHAALGIAGRVGVDLVAASAVDDVLAGRTSPEDAVSSALGTA
ncbi:MAG: NAD(P)H-dependent glycerol-3-phosphate dehydrogenase [Actinomycetota bacterium]